MRVGLIALKTVLLTALVAAVCGAGCVITVEPPADQPSDGNGDGTTGQVTIRIVNESNVGLDPELFLADTPVSVADLFVPARKYTEFGVFGVGLIGAFSSDSFAVDCTTARLIGTTGGSFGDTVQTIEGSGTQRVLSQDLQFNCGDRITFTYSRTGDGFQTTVSVD